MDLQGKTALITGAARRIGREIALTLASRGVSTVIHYHRSRREALQLQKEIESFGVDAPLVPADLSFRPKKSVVQTIRRFIREVYRLVPKLHILVNNAAIFYPTPFGKITEKHWDDFLTVNLKSPFFLAQEIGMRMARQFQNESSKRGRECGKIINLVDWTGLRPHPKYLPYAVSKAGLIAATVGMARALAPYVQVNSIAPGPILPAKGMMRRQEKAMTERTLLKRFGHPNDIAETVRFLCEDTDFITGAMIPVDGGSSIA